MSGLPRVRGEGELNVNSSRGSLSTVNHDSVFSILDAAPIDQLDCERR